MAETVRTRWFYLAVFLIALAAAWPELSQPGLLNTRGGGDSPFLLQRLHQLETAVLDGHFPVRWMPDANYGYGYPFYNFYAPLSIYITFLFRLIGFSFVRSIHLSHLLGYFVAGWGMFVLVRRWFAHGWAGNGRLDGNWAGLLAAAAYTFAPFHLVNVYVRGDSLAEFWAMAFYPLVILAADGLFGGGRRAIALFGLAYAGLILSHNISALIFSPFLLLYLLLRWYFRDLPQRTQRSQRNKKDNQSPLSNLIFGFLLALALAAWFFVPALAEQSLAQLDTVTSGYFHYSNHFLGTAVQPLIQSTFFVDYGVADREAFRMGLVQTAVSVAGLIGVIWLWRRRKIHAAALFILLTVAVSSFMLTPLSSLLWQHLPLLDFTQFPWRFLSVQAFGGALAVGALAMALPKPKWWALPLIGLLLFSSLGRLKPDYLPLTDAEITAESLAQYEWFTGNIGTTISFEYLPPTVQPRPYTSNWLNSGDRWQVKPLFGELLSAELTNQRSTKQEWLLETAVPSTLIFPTLHWPGWAAWVDGEQVTIRPSAGSGLIQLDVPVGRHDVVLRLTRTPVRLAAEWVSLTAVLLTIWLLKPSRRWFSRATRLNLRPNIFVSSDEEKASSDASRLHPFAFENAHSSILVWLCLGMLLLAVGLRLWPQTALPNDLRSWDFVNMGYLHPTAEGIAYSSGAVLRSLTMAQTNIQPGESLRIELQWEVPPTEDVTLALFSPAVNWTTDPNLPPPLPLAQQTVSGGAEKMNFELLFPENVPLGLFVPRLTVANSHPLTPSGSSRGALFLQPIRIEKANNALTESEQLMVRAVAVQQTSLDRLNVQLAWLTAQPLSQNYNVALRLTDAQGRFLRLVDVQPGYGFLPSSGWPAGEWVDDWLTMPLPPAEEGHALPFALVAQLYDVTEPNTAVLSRRLGELIEGESGLQFRPTEPNFDLPEGIVLETAVFGDQIQLQGYRLAQTEETLDLTLVWQAMQHGQTDYTRFVHLIAADAGGAPLAQADSPPRYGSYPTSQWTAGEVIEDGLQLDLADVPPGRYQLAVGFYQQTAPQQFEQLYVQNEAGELLSDGRFVLPIPLTIEP